MLWLSAVLAASALGLALAAHCRHRALVARLVLIDQQLTAARARLPKTTPEQKL